MGPGNQGRQFWDPFLSYKYGLIGRVGSFIVLLLHTLVYRAAIHTLHWLVPTSSTHHLPVYHFATISATISAVISA
jgi:hypothetical protein